MTGAKEQTIEIDFSSLATSDKEGGTNFIQGGRVYYEAFLFGYHINSFTSKGFFD